jgi:hypothetical protein
MQQAKYCAPVAGRTLAAVGIVLMSIVAAQAADKTVISSTVPANGDVNPYGIVFVPEGFPAGVLMPGDVLVSNFNNSTNTQGTGTTVIKLTPTGAVAPAGKAQVFFNSQPIGLTTALGILQAGFVVVGNVPTAGGVAQQGSLQIVDASGNGKPPIIDPTFLDSPWDLTVNDEGSRAQIFVSNVLSGTVSRLDVMVSAAGVSIAQKVTVAIGYLTRTDPNALVVGPTGVAYDPAADVLYVASTGDNAIFGVAGAGKAIAPVTKGTVVFNDPRHLRGPLALVFAANGHLITSNGDAVNPDPAHPSEVIEFTKSGEFVRQFSLDPALGSAFGLATVINRPSNFDFATVNDDTNAVAVYHRVSDAFAATTQ